MNLVTKSLLCQFDGITKNLNRADTGDELENKQVTTSEDAVSDEVEDIEDKDDVESNANNDEGWVNE